MSEWKEYKVSDLCHGIYDGPHATPEKTNHGPIFLGISNLCSGRIDLSDVDHLSEESFKKWTRRITPQANDVVFSYETRLGEAALIPDGLRCCLGRRMALMRPNLEKVDPQFLLYVYLSPAFQETITARTIYGSTVNRIALIEFPLYPIKVPSLKIQKSISSILYNIDAKIDNLRRQNETLEEIARSIFKHWFIDFEFPNADGKPYKSSGGAMVRSDLGDIPEGWRVATLNDCLSLIIDYRGKTPKKLDCDWSMEGIPALSAKNIKNGKILVEQLVHFADEALYQKWMKDELQKGDILLTSEAPLGEVYYLASDNKYILSQRLFSLRTKKEFSSAYLYFWLRSPEGQNLINRRATGSTVQGIRQSELRNVEVIIPKGEILENASDLWMSILEKIEANYQAINIIIQTRDALLPKLMSGQLRVKE